MVTYMELYPGVMQRLSATYWMALNREITAIVPQRDYSLVKLLGTVYLFLARLRPSGLSLGQG